VLVEVCDGRVRVVTPVDHGVAFEDDHGPDFWDVCRRNPVGSVGTLSVRAGRLRSLIAKDHTGVTLWMAQGGQLFSSDGLKLPPSTHCATIQVQIDKPEVVDIRDRIALRVWLDRDSALSYAEWRWCCGWPHLHGAVSGSLPTPPLFKQWKHNHQLGMKRVELRGIMLTNYIYYTSCFSNRRAAASG
jgi:hypothetical protein